jgi:hypothetical protein
MSLFDLICFEHLLGPRKDDPSLLLNQIRCVVLMGHDVLIRLLVFIKRAKCAHLLARQIVVMRVLISAA